MYVLKILYKWYNTIYMENDMKKQHSLATFGCISDMCCFPIYEKLHVPLFSHQFQSFQTKYLFIQVKQPTPATNTHACFCLEP